MWVNTVVHKLHPGHAKECVTTTARITGANSTVGLLSRRDASSVVMVENASDKALKSFVACTFSVPDYKQQTHVWNEEKDSPNDLITGEMARTHKKWREFSRTGESTREMTRLYETRRSFPTVYKGKLRIMSKLFLRERLPADDNCLWIDRTDWVWTAL